MTQIVTAFLTRGIDNNMTVKRPVRVIDTIAAENATGSSVREAAPMPCALAPMERPVDNGSSTLRILSHDDPNAPPNNPVITTIKAVIVGSAEVSFAPARARGDVMQRVSVHSRRLRGNPNSNDIANEPNKPKIEDTNVVKATLEKFLNIIDLN